MKERLAVFFLLLLSACGPRGEAQDITGHLPDLRFSLVSDGNARVTERAYRGRVVLLYFGFAGCSAQCPAALEKIAGVLGRMGGEADGVRVLFVTVDPSHDTPRVLRAYAGLFDARHITGLTGRAADIGALAKRCRSAYRPGAAAAHGTAMYVFGRDGRARLLVSADDSAESLLHALQRLVRA